MINKIRIFVILLLVTINVMAAAPETKTFYQYGATFFTSWSAACTFGAVASGGSTGVGPNAGGNCNVFNASGVQINTVAIGSGVKTRCSDASSPDTTKPLAQQCSEPCPTGESRNTAGVCVFVRCPQGDYWTRDANLTCIPPTDKTCPVGTVVSGTTCVPKTCPAGYTLNGTTGACMPPEEYPCPTGTTKQPDGNCKANDPTQGPKGDTGDKGEKGDRGEKGDKGDQGVAGTDGLKGDTGEQGAQGNQGAVGSAGRNGTDGRNGVDGAQGIRGLQGAQGSQGAQGATGSQGLQGIQGAQGLQGAQGRTGDTGSSGINGINGATGTAGAQGIQGTAGVAGTDGEKGEAGKGLCEENPGLAVCKNSTVAGSCEAVSCTGDAIQCATLRAAAALQCAQATSDAELAASPLNAVGQAAVDGVIEPGAPTKENGEHIDLPSSLDANGWLGGGKCFADKTITLQGHQILIPLSAGCDAMLVLRYALMVVASLVSFRILSRAILS